jgi:hypothetical protein|tara:strand:+ start:703 stop:1638 length:936 start_codon:yes stop_codon:yes gene_type:complete
MKEKKITLNSEKRKVIADQFQSFYEDKVKDKLVQAKQQYDLMREKAKVAIEKVVRFHQPQEDVDTIRRMISKYSSSGGELYHDNCFQITMPITKVDDEGREYETTDDVHVKFDMGRKFARAYYRDEMKAKGLNPDFHLSIDNDYSKRNPKYYADESACNKFLGFQTSSNDDKSITTPRMKWEEDFKLWVIGTSYCRSRQFKVDETTLEFFKMYVQSADNVIKEHEQMYSYVEGKMKTLRLGLKSYRTFDQAKALADKVGVVLNETMMNESSSLALSIYSPDNLASLLEDKEVLTREQKIAIARKQMQQTVN